MKKILSFLLTIVFLQAQMFAMSGGPTYGAKGENIVGSYSGVLNPAHGASSDVKGPNGEAVSSLGIFSLSVPITGYASGIFLMFAEGKTFPGTIDAVGNALKGTLTGLLQAKIDRDISEIVAGAVVTITVTTSVNGTIKANVSEVQGTASAGFGNKFQRVTGEATLVFDEGQLNDEFQPKVTNILEYKVDGVKQSNDVPSTSSGSVPPAA